MNESTWWASESLWRKAAIWVTAVMAIILIGLTFDTVAKITAGGKRVPGYEVINQRIHFELDHDRGFQVPRIGKPAPLFGKTYSPAEAEELVSLGKLTTQAKNCMNCHTILGNGAYYAPDLTKAWLDPGWINEEERENLMLAFLQHPEENSRTFGTGRRMPNLDITEEEARGIIAFLKWMSSIDTNGFPHGFTPMPQEDDR